MTIGRVRSAMPLMLVCAGYLALAGSTVTTSTIQYDEFTDLLIASSLVRRPLLDIDLDPSQARLPMYVTAAASRVANAIVEVESPVDLLHLSRWLSIIATVAAICGTWFVGVRLFDRPIAFMAAGLFAFSPYVLGFGRDALTQGDAFTAAVVLLALACFIRFEQCATPGSIVAFGLSLAIATATKFYLLFLLPTFFAIHMLRLRGKRRTALEAPPSTAGSSRTVLGLALTTGVSSIIAVGCSIARVDQPPALRRALALTALGFWLVTLLGIVACAGAAVVAARRDTAQSRWTPTAAWAAIVPLTVAGALALFPAHTMNPAIVPSLWDRIANVDGSGRLFDQAGQAARLYLGILLFKLGFPFGLFSLAALAWAARSARRDARFQILVIVLVGYLALLATLPLQQPFWLISVYPLVMLCLASFIAHLFRASRATRWRPALVFALAGAFAWLSVSVILVYPTFGYYGLETMGQRWLGAESRGYRAPVVVTNDGSTEAIAWLEANAPPGSVILSYLDDVHLLEYVDTAYDLPFELRHVIRLEHRRPAPEDLLDSDYAVLRIIDDFGPETPFHDPDFRRRFGTAPVHEIFRGRGGYRMPVMRIFRRVEM